MLEPFVQNKIGPKCCVRSHVQKFDIKLKFEFDIECLVWINNELSWAQDFKLFDKLELEHYLRCFKIDWILIECECVINP